MSSFKLTTAVFLVVISVIFQTGFSKSIETVENGLVAASDHNLFFKALDTQEKLAMMQLAIRFFDADEYIEIQPYPVLGVDAAKLDGAVPFPELPVGNSIPDTLVSHFLNGKVPKNFQKEFTKWLKKDYNLTETNFVAYRTTGSFCRQGEDCPILDDIGGLCCPFG